MTLKEEEVLKSQDSCKETTAVQEGRQHFTLAKSMTFESWSDGSAGRVLATSV